MEKSYSVGRRACRWSRKAPTWWSPMVRPTGCPTRSRSARRSPGWCAQAAACI